MFGICLGHQLIGRALGADTHRLKFGHTVAIIRSEFAIARSSHHRAES